MLKHCKKVATSVSFPELAQCFEFVIIELLKSLFL